MRFGRAGGCRFRVFPAFQAGRGTILGMSPGGVTRRGRSAICSRNLQVRRQCARIRITLFRVVSILPPLGRGRGEGGCPSFALLPLQDAAGSGRAFTPGAVRSIKLPEFHLFPIGGSSRRRRAGTAGQENLDAAPLHVAAGLQRGGPSAAPTSLSFVFIILSPAK